jgi:hypothetical protein
MSEPTNDLQHLLECPILRRVAERASLGDVVVFVLGNDGRMRKAVAQTVLRTLSDCGVETVCDHSPDEPRVSLDLLRAKGVPVYIESCGQPRRSGRRSGKN